MIRFSFGAILLSLVLAGCAISPPPTTPRDRFCGFTTYPITLPLSQPSDHSAGAQDLASAIQARLSERTAPPGQPYRLLALSGGSLHGAFGAGYLDGWRASGGTLPEFDVVTGISTGSILSTFAFLGDTSRAVERYAISHESELLRPIARNRQDGSMSPFELVRVLRRGAVADLGPLRDLLLRGDATHPPEISPAVMRRVAEGYRNRRTLVVGAVDIDSGQAVAFDLTKMAQDYVDKGAPGAEETPDQLRLRTCYVEAIIASSSAPLAAVPVFIDNSMYADGGMRFGMFADDVLQGANMAEKSTGRTLEYYVIANGDLEVEHQCGRADRRRCELEPPNGAATDERARWSLLRLALRSEQVLANQVYRFSADRIIGERDTGNNVWFARIDRARLDAHRFAMDDAALNTLPPDEAHPDGRHTCLEWYDEDDRLLAPIQFFPRYMHCLIDYGRGRWRDATTDAPAWDVFPIAGKPEEPQVADPPPTP